MEGGDLQFYLSIIQLQIYIMGLLQGRTGRTPNVEKDSLVGLSCVNIIIC